MNWKSKLGESAAHFAAISGNLVALEVIKEQGGDLKMKSDTSNESPLDYSMKSAHVDVFKVSAYEDVITIR